MERRIRVLLIAEAANPEWTSVPLIGWSLSQAISKLTDAHLVTQQRNRDALLRAGILEGRDFTVIDNESTAAPIWRVAQLLRGGSGKGWTTQSAFAALAYYSFEQKVWARFKSRIAAGEFDLVHRITPLSPTHPSIIAGRLARYRVPFVVGPLNGGVPWPPAFRDRQHAEKEWLSYVRALYKLLPAYRSTLRNSAAILVGSQHTASEVPKWAQHKCIYMPENGIDPLRFQAKRRRSPSLPLQVAFVGRLVPYKGADLLIEATAAFMRSGTLNLHIVGDGPQRDALRNKACNLNVDKNIRFYGQIPHERVQDILVECDCLALPSVREFGGGVVLEAMALGAPPIVADYAGPSELVDESCGVRVPFSNADSLVQGMREAIGQFIQMPERLVPLGGAARERALKAFTWDAKAKEIVKVYDAIASPPPSPAERPPAARSTD